MLVSIKGCGHKSFGKTGPIKAKLKEVIYYKACYKYPINSTEFNFCIILDLLKNWQQWAEWVEKKLGRAKTAVEVKIQCQKLSENCHIGQNFLTSNFQTMFDTPLLVNIKGCGYPPEIACAKFASDYEGLWERNETFPCYYSRVNPWIVLIAYNPSEMIGSIIASVTIPNVIFVISLIVLLYWYCPYCQAKFHKYDEQIDQDLDAQDDEE